jgi:exoribonuclease-2
MSAYVLFEESGKFLAGRVLSRAESSLQVELASGKRAKVKQALALLEFDSPTPEALLQQAQLLAADIDLDLAWECAPDEEFGFAEVACDYFGNGAHSIQQAAALFRLYEAPHYFRRAGKGRFRKAPAEIVQQALAAIAKRAAIDAQVRAWADELKAQQCPAPIKEQLYRILFKPDKQAPEYRAVVMASREAQRSPLDLLQDAGAMGSAYEFHWQRFVFEHFPKGTGFGTLPNPTMAAASAPMAAVRAFSIDDSATTEIDDALSVQGLGSDRITLGIHIAAPGLGIQPDDMIDQVARHRMSTVYMPGYKITMLPDALVQQFTLQQGQTPLALSLYLDIDAQSMEVLGSRSAIEQVPIAENIRYDLIEDLLNQEFFDRPASTPSAPVHAFEAELRWLYALAKHRKAWREERRGKPEGSNRPDYAFKVATPDGGLPSGDEPIQISARRRGSPLDLIVAEAMILANQTWGQWLADLGVPALYRSQASLAPGVKVRMGSKPLPHAGLGVPCYAWSTSPLRRYTDLFNQWQILACVKHGTTAALAAPFKPKDASIFAILSGFESAYAAYQQFQNGMERYWTLRYLMQENIQELDATLLREGLARADSLPLVVPVMGTEGLERGAHIRIRLGQPDLMSLELNATLVGRIEATDEAMDTEGTEEEDLEPATVHIAMDVQEDPAATPT